MRELLQDVRYGVRMLVRQPGFTGVVALTLALAIGANTVIFSIASFLLLRPLPFGDHETIAAIYAIDPQRGQDREMISAPDLLDWREAASSFEALGAFANDTVTLTGRGEPQRLSATAVTANLFDIWRIEMAAGRAFQPGEDAIGAPPVAMISYGFWQRELAGDPGVVGDTLRLDGRLHTVVGVVTPEMEIGNLSLIDVWTPLTLDPATARDDRRLRVFGRLRDGVTIEAASAEVGALADRQAAEYPETHEGWSARAIPLLEAMTGRNSWLILALLGLVVGFVLVIACANVANLMLARVVARRKELAVRASLGAGGARLARQLVTESALLGLTGGLLGLALARGGLALIKAVSFEPFFHQIEIDYRVLTFVAILSLLTPLLFGLLPALHAARLNLSQTLTEAPGRTSGGVRGRRSRNALVVAQQALAVTLLILSVLVIRTAIAEARLDVGFDPANVLTLRLELDELRYPDDARVGQFYDDVLTRLAALPGVTDAAVVDELPVFSNLAAAPFAVEGQPLIRDLGDRPWALRVVASPRYFAAFDIPLLRGRAFTAEDREDAAGAVIVSAEAERRYWPDDDPVGRRIRLADDGAWLTIVGVVGDVFNGQELSDTPHPQLYLPAAQSPGRAMAFAIRTTADPAGLTPAVRGEIRAVDPEQAVYDVRSMDQVFHEQLASDRLLFGLFISFAIVALVLATGGLYGLMAYSVAQRTQEFGVRLALGARQGHVVRQVLRQGLALATVGLPLGLLGGFGLAHAVASLLYGVGPNDPSTYGGVAVLLLAVAALASYVPARRAVGIDPVRTLRA